MESINLTFNDSHWLTDIYSPKATPPEVDPTNPLNLYYTEDWTRLGKVNVHVRPECAEAYENSPWKLVGPIIEDYLTSINEVEADTAIGADELCDVYTLSGAAAASMCRYGDLRNSLPKGLYIVRTASGKSSKIAVK